MEYQRSSVPTDPNNSVIRTISILAITMLVAQVVFAATAGPATAATRVLNDGESFPNGFTVPAGETWEFNPGTDTKVTTSGNVIVLGTLRVRPSSGSVEHFLQFTAIDESKFIGGGMTHADAPNDIGLWVEDAGILDISGTPMTPWSYQWQPGWSAAEDIVGAPNSAGDYTTFTQVDSAAQVPDPNPLGYSTELLNLTRNVRIEGTPGGRTHILIHAPNAQSGQTIKYAAIRYVSPWIGNTDATGRYGLHFHHNENATQGSVVEGVVIRDADNHAFVPHASHGITFDRTIAYNTTSDAYWWDPSDSQSCGSSDGCNKTNDVVYDTIVAAGTRPDPSHPHSAAAIRLGGGDNMTIVDSVVVGMGDSGANVSAYHWPSIGRGVWTFVNNVAHNNRSHGIFVWQNTPGEANKNHVIDGYTAYYNATTAIDHGAYGNSYVYKNLVLLENATGADRGIEQYAEIQSHALGKASMTTTGIGATDTQVWNGVRTDGAKLLILEHNTPLQESVRFLFCDFSEIVFDERSSDDGGYDFIECGLDISDFDRTGINSGTVIRVQDGNSAYQFVGNGPKQTIAPFFGNPQPPPPPSLPPPPSPLEGDLPGLVDVSSGKWYLYGASGGLDSSFYFGNPGDFPIYGDWDGDGVETPGLYRQSDGFVYLRNSNTEGVADIKFFFGNPGDVPIAGDFNGDGFDTVSIYRPSSQTFFIINKLGKNNGGLGAAEFSYVFGNPGDKPFVGDFDGDRVETVGLHRESTGLVYYRNSHTQGIADNQFVFGDPGDRFIAGDWTDDGVFTPGLYRPSSRTLFFKYSNTQGNADNQFTPVPNNSGWVPVAGSRP